MTTLTLEALAPLLAGPASAVFIMFLLLVGVWKLTNDKLIPLLGSALDRHLSSIDALVATNSQDHKAMIECLQRIEVRIEADKDDNNAATLRSQRGGL